MRPLHTSELELEDFSPSVIPRYAILSHRWGKEEVTFEDMIKGLAQTKKGYSKIAGSCKQANNDGYEYIWVDTCCINKDSSAELSEAINSMYAWYKNAGICYAYLVDVPDEVNPEEDVKFASSDWFNRGWTLQELLAPDEVVFFSTGWTSLGNKSSLCSTLSRITRIDNEALAGNLPIKYLSVAKRMSWASRRKTSRPEDVAYCLMGLFDVNMPMLYGEGKNAFIRLQEEIMKDSDDESLFAWMNEEASPHSPHGLLAESPAWFNHSGDVETFKSYKTLSSNQRFSKTNKGLHMFSWISPREGGFAMDLDCIRAGNPVRLRICLIKVGDFNQYARVMANELFRHVPSKYETDHTQSVYVLQDVKTLQYRTIYLDPILRLRSWPSFQDGYKIHKIISWSDRGGFCRVGSMHDMERITQNYHFWLQNKDGIIALILVLQRVGPKSFFAIVFASSSEKGITFDVRNCDDIKSGDCEKLAWSSRFCNPGDVAWSGSEPVQVHAQANIRDVSVPLGPRVLQADYMVDIEVLHGMTTQLPDRLLYQDSVPNRGSTQAKTSAVGSPKSPDLQA